MHRCKRHLILFSIAIFCLTKPVASQNVPKADSQKPDKQHLFILSGQSNMAGLKPEESFIPRIESEFGPANVVIVKDAHGGQPIRRWYRKWESSAGEKLEPTGDLYDRLMKKVTSATGERTFDTVTFIWMQGERDAREQHADVYAKSFLGLVEQLKSDLDHQKIRVVIGRLSDFDMSNKRYPDWTRIREVQVELARKFQLGAWVDTDDLNDGFNRQGKEIKNDLHYSEQGYKTLGRRFAESAINLIRKKPTMPKRRFQSTIYHPVRSIVYKSIANVELSLFVFLPENFQPTDERTAIVFFFGGGWTGGTPHQFYRQSEYFASRGAVAICADYRTKSRHGTTPQECVKDAKSAIRWIRAHADDLGIAESKIVAAGGSAGGHLAAATATLKQFDDETDDSTVSCTPNALVLFNPVVDNGKQGYGHKRVKEYWNDFSPYHNLKPGTPPTIFHLGTKDPLIPATVGIRYQEAMTANGDRCELHLYEDQNHGFFNEGNYFSETLLRTDLFLKSLNLLEGQPQEELLYKLKSVVRSQ